VRRRRPAIAAQAERRSRERRTHLGGAIRALRKRREWTQRDLAGRAHLERSLISRAERGIGPYDLDMLDRIALAFGVPLRVEFARDPNENVADAGHLAMQELVLRLGRGLGYSAAFELATKPTEPWRSIDVLLASEARGWLICVECWNTIGDVGAAARASERKRAEAEAVAVGMWGADARAALVWVVRASARNRALVDRYPEVFASRFQGSSRRWVAALNTGTSPPAQPGLIWCDVRATRLFGWRQSRE
jgi:transcriptional regulator with XRE-family HTH domain